MRPVAIYRWGVFLLAALYLLQTIIFADFHDFGGPFRFLTQWALVASFFCASRMMALTEGRSDRRWDGVVCMTAAINALVVMLYWGMFVFDPLSVTSGGRLAPLYQELYWHLVGPLLQIIDSIFIHRSFHRRKRPALGWFVGVICAYAAWSELALRPLTDQPVGRVTTGLPYPFLNDLALAERLVFYGGCLVAGIAIIFSFAHLSAWVRSRFPAPKGL